MWDGPRGAKSRGKAMNAPGKLEKGLAIVLLLLSTGAFLNLFLKHGKFRFEANAGLPFMQVIWAGLYLFVLFFLIKEARGFWRLLLRGWPFLLLLAICLLRSEEHTSELQSRLHLVCRLLLAKKKQ